MNCSRHEFIPSELSPEQTQDLHLNTEIVQPEVEPKAKQKRRNRYPGDSGTIEKQQRQSSSTELSENDDNLMNFEVELEIKEENISHESSLEVEVELEIKEENLNHESSLEER